MERRLALPAAIGLVVTLLCRPAYGACSDPVHDDVRNSFRGAGALCHNLSLQTSVYSAKARTRLKAAAASFQVAEQTFDPVNPLKALANAAKGVNKTFSAGHADPVLLLQLSGIRIFMADSIATYLRCTLDDLIAQHPQEAARAEDFYARALAAHQAQDFTTAIKLYRKGFKKVKAFLGA